MPDFVHGKFDLVINNCDFEADLKPVPWASPIPVNQYFIATFDTITQPFECIIVMYVEACNFIGAHPHGSVVLPQLCFQFSFSYTEQ